MRIPYSQLRFPAAEQLTFGINAMRYIQRKNEQVWLVHVPKTESGLASRIGHLDGLDGVVTAPHRGAAAVRGEPRRVRRAVRPAIPSTTATRLFAGAGLDLKYRLSSSLTLDGTINPDFGQVEVDPAVVNLTAFETFFEEKRPFFIEGANIFSNFGRDRRQQLLGLQPRRAACSSIRGASGGRRRERPTATSSTRRPPRPSSARRSSPARRARAGASACSRR